jgi:hypothetical protein
MRRERPERLSYKAEISANSAAVSFQFAAVALALTCSGDVAPAITDATVGCAASQEKANSKTL